MTSVTKSHLSVDTIFNLFLFFQIFRHSSLVTVTKVTEAIESLLSLLSLSPLWNGGIGTSRLLSLLSMSLRRKPCQ